MSNKCPTALFTHTHTHTHTLAYTHKECANGLPAEWLAPAPRKPTFRSSSSPSKSLCVFFSFFFFPILLCYETGFVFLHRFVYSMDTVNGATAADAFLDDFFSGNDLVSFIYQLESFNLDQHSFLW